MQHVFSSIFLTTLLSDNSVSDQMNPRKTGDLLKTLKEDASIKEDPRAMFRASVRDTKAEAYAQKVVELVRGLKCFEKCGVFDHGFKDDVSRVVDVLVTFPALDSHSLANTVENFNIIAKGMKPFVSSVFFQTTFMQAVDKRSDTKDVDLRPLDAIPEKFIPASYLQSSQDYQSTGTGSLDFQQQSPYEGTNSEEREMDYWREDHSLNSNHWMFHTLFPVQIPTERQQERFAYFHRMILARYITERAVAGISQIQPLTPQAMRSPFRSLYPNRRFGDVSPTRETCTIPANEVDATEERLAAAVAALGESQESFTKLVQDDYHDNGHLTLSQHCSQNFPPQPGFLFGIAYAARDPLFYRWHYEIEILLKRHKDRNSYTLNDLQPAAGVVVNEIQLRSRCNEPNLVETFYDTRTFPVRFGREAALTSVNERILNHEEFSVTVRLTNSQQQPKNVILRMFIGLQQFVNQGQWMVELDRWVHTLSGNREEVITRRSQDSFSTDKLGLEQWSTLSENDEVRRVNCAWPRNLYLPRGRPGERTEFVLIVFVHDVAQGVNEGVDPNVPGMICGTRPNSPRITFDSRDFGFPFDKEWNGVDRAEIVANRNQQFGNVSTVIRIAFSERRAGSCDSGPAPGQPTAAPPQPTAAPEQPTAAPPQPTAAPEQPTAAPPQPTAAPPPLTAAPQENPTSPRTQEGRVDVSVPATPTSGPPRGSCPQGFLLSGNSCFFVFRQPRTYEEAQRACGSRGGHLLFNIADNLNILQGIMGIVMEAMPAGTQVRFWMDRSVILEPTCAYSDVQDTYARGIDCNAQQGPGFVMLAVCERQVE